MTDTAGPGGVNAQMTAPYTGDAPCVLPGGGPRIELLNSRGQVLVSTDSTLLRAYPLVTIRPGHSLLADISWGQPCDADAGERVTELRLYADIDQNDRPVVATITADGNCDSEQFPHVAVVDSAPIGIR